VSPLTVSGDPGPLTLMPPGEEVAVYDVIGEPPSEEGAANATVACALPAVAMATGGALGNDRGVTLFDGAEEGPTPTAFVAVTVNV